MPSFVASGTASPFPKMSSAWDRVFKPAVGAGIAPTVKRAKTYDGLTGQMIQDDSAFSPEDIANGAGRFPGGIHIENPGGMMGGGRGRFGNPGGVMAPPSPNALEANNRPAMGSLEGFFNMQRPGAAPLDMLNEKSDFENFMSKQSMRSPYTGMPFGALSPYNGFRNAGAGAPVNPAAMIQNAFGAAWNLLGKGGGRGADTESGFMGLAKGGKAGATQPFVVGEDGPELFVPGQDGRVLSKKDSKDAIAKTLWEILPPMMKKPRFAEFGASMRGNPLGMQMRMPLWAGQSQMPQMPQMMMPNMAPHMMMPPWMMGGGYGGGGGYFPQMMAPGAMEMQAFQSPTLRSFYANNPNAPDMPGLNSPLSRYLRMGINDASRWASARAAVQATLARQKADADAVAMNPPTHAVTSAGPFGGLDLQSIYGSGGTNLPPSWHGRATGPLPKLLPVRASAENPWQETQRQQYLLDTPGARSNALEDLLLN